MTGFFWLKINFIFYNPGHFFCLSTHFHSIKYFALTRSQSNSRENNKAFPHFTRKNVVNDFKKSIIHASRIQVCPEGWVGAIPSNPANHHCGGYSDMASPFVLGSIPPSCPHDAASHLRREKPVFTTIESLNENSVGNTRLKTERKTCKNSTCSWYEKMKLRRPRRWSGRSATALTISSKTSQPIRNSRNIRASSPRKGVATMWFHHVSLWGRT